MAATLLGSLLVELGLDSGQFKSGLSGAEKELRKTKQKFEKLGQGMADLGGKMSLAITAPLAAFGATAFKAASDAAELQSAFNQTFGAMAGSMNKWAEETGNAMGRSTQEMQKAANTFGIFFNTAADPAKAAAMSQTFSKLAQDLGSFYNTDTETAIQKLRSGLSGESEPLRDFGVFLTEASVKAKAMEMGLAGVGNELTEQEKILARYQLILESTTNAQGDVERTADGTANQIRKAQAAFQELQVVVGTKLLPVITPLIEKIGAAFEWFSQLPEPVQDTALVIGGLMAAVGPLLVGIGMIAQGLPAVISGFSMLAGGFKVIVPIIVTVGKALAGLALANPWLVALAAAAAGVYLAWKNWDKIWPIIKRLYTEVKTWLQDKLGKVWDWVKGKIDAVKGWFYGLYDAVVGHSYIPDMVDGIAAEMSRLDAVMVNPAKAAAERTKQIFEKLGADVQAIMAELFPDAREIADFQNKLSALDQGIRAGGAGGYSVEQLQAARGRLIDKAPDGAVLPLSDQLSRFGNVPLGDTARIDAELSKLTEAANDNASKIGVANVRIVQSFKDMAEATLDSLQRVASAIKGGGFLDILSSVVGLGLQLGSMGVFGKSIQTNINSAQKVPGFANGTRYAPGGLAVVGERGPELVNLPRGASVTPNRALGGIGGAQVQVIPSPYFDVVVNGHIQRAAPTIAGLGAAEASSRASRTNTRRIA